MGKGNVLVVADNFYPHTGGLEVYATNTAIRLAKRGYKVSVLTYQYDATLPLQQTHEGVEIYRVPSYGILPHVYSIPKLMNPHLRKTIKHLSEQSWDAVLTNTRFFTSCLLGRKIARVSKSPFIHIEHGNSYVKHSNLLIQTCAWLYDQTLGRFIISSADKVITISKKGDPFVRKLGATNTDVVYNSVDTAKFIREPESELDALRKEYGVEKDDFVVYYVGRLIFAKGLQHLIAIIDKVPKAKLIIVGGGPYRAELEKMAQGKRVDFRGQLPQHVMRRIYSISHCLCNPSYNEGIPTNILEAGAIGVPVITTDVGGVREVLPDIRYGFIVQPKDEKVLLDSLLTMQTNKAMVHNMTKQLKHHVQTAFDWDVNIDKLAHIIDSMKKTVKVAEHVQK